MDQETPKKRVKGKAAVEAMREYRNRGKKPRREPYGREPKKTDMPRPIPRPQMTKKAMKKPK
jgi:hypothetical protein